MVHCARHHGHLSSPPPCIPEQLRLLCQTGPVLLNARCLQMPQGWTQLRAVAPLLSLMLVSSLPCSYVVEGDAQELLGGRGNAQRGILTCNAVHHNSNGNRKAPRPEQKPRVFTHRSTCAYMQGQLISAVRCGGKATASTSILLDCIPSSRCLALMFWSLMFWSGRRWLYQLKIFWHVRTFTAFQIPLAI